MDTQAIVKAAREEYARLILIAVPMLRAAFNKRTGDLVDWIEDPPEMFWELDFDDASGWGQVRADLETLAPLASDGDVMHLTMEYDPIPGEGVENYRVYEDLRAFLQGPDFESATCRRRRKLAAECVAAAVEMLKTHSLDECEVDQFCDAGPVEQLAPSLVPEFDPRWAEYVEGSSSEDAARRLLDALIVELAREECGEW